MGPNPRDRTAPAWLTSRPYAHRGLHGGSRPENGLAAFQAAIDAEFGIELDVRISRCGTVFVFHDASLVRLCGTAGAIEDSPDAALADLRLAGSCSPIPTLADVLALIEGRAPLLIELKSPSWSNVPLCEGVAALLRGYRGPVAIMAFDAGLIRWFARHAPDIVRGLIISEEKKKIKGLLERRIALKMAGPDFLAYDIRSLPSAFAARTRARGLPLLCWTVRSPEDLETALRHADQIIHELPDRDMHR